MPQTQITYVVHDVCPCLPQRTTSYHYASLSNILRTHRAMYGGAIALCYVAINQLTILLPFRSPPEMISQIY